MQAVLNFSGKDKQLILAFLRKQRQEGLRNEFEEAKARIDDCVITLYKSGKLLIQGNNAEKVKELILEKVQAKEELILGIDEVGRGESFGPLVVAGVLGTANALRELRDSKKTRNVSEKAKLVREKAKHFTVEIPAREIDALRESGKNLNQIEANAINKIIKHFENAGNFRIIVDGARINGVKEKAEFLPKADDLIPQVAAASIIAKNARDESKDKGKRKTWNVKG